MNSSQNITFSLEEEDYDEFKKNGIPITAYLIVLCVVGTVGNTHVFLTYFLKYKANVYKTFILCLAVVDLLGCVFCIPATLYIIRHPNTVQSSLFCKVNRAASYFVGAFSLLILDCIAVERYRKVCQATRVQFTIRTTRILCAANFVFVLVVIVIPVTIIYGINRKQTPTHSLLGYECTVLDHFKSSTLTKVYRGFIFFIFVLLLIVSVVLYSLVVMKIYAHQKKHKSTDDLPRTMCCMPRSKHNGSDSLSSEDGRSTNRYSQEKDISSDLSISATTAPGSFAYNVSTERFVLSTDARVVNAKTNISETGYDDQKRQLTGTGNTYLDALNERKRKKLDRSRNITMVFLVVSIMSFGGYLPYLLSTLVRNISRSLFENFASNYAALDVFIRWMVFLNNAINPIVYGFMDNKFRNELSNCYIKMARCCCVFRRD
ncbi:galanin-like G-protein coupled receptor npr-9 [Mizuhopecten yessoensis]|uniref:galanin-like G-protein coupled receptor npr-9 n=1 Tax=Mizuhopecten yessoensis TaxID=6573 RepID=UPI000B4594D5|nr:galanin-like G-protein coupled receptor npr-9 [Mizuhopecten yessoensis]